jgi:Omp85 superfamily domain
MVGGADVGAPASANGTAAFAVMRSIAVATCLLLLRGGVAHAQNVRESNQPSPPVIDKITIVRQNVFSGEEKREGILGSSPFLTTNRWGAKLAHFTGPNGWDFAEWANRLHFKTQRQVIERELLFHVGDPLDLSLLQETERNLRELGFLRDASVTTQSTEPGHAEVTVFTQDAWTTDPRFSFGVLGGGHVVGSAGISESNLFGFGKAAEFYYSSERYRDVNFLGYDDPRVMGTHWHLLAQGSEDSDGRVRNALLEYPFWSLEIPDSIGASFWHVADQERLFSEDERTLRHWQTAATFSIAHALVGTSELVRRIGLRYQLWNDSFGPAPLSEGPSAFGLQPRRTSAIELTFTEWHPDFVKAYFLDLLGRPEDRDVGSAIELRAGYSPNVIGASRSEFVFGGSASVGTHVDDYTYGWLWLQASGREGAGQIRDSFLTAEAIAYRRLADLFNRSQTLVVDARLDVSDGLYRDHEFVIGSDDGRLRGYPINYRAGTQRLSFHIEDRLAIVEDLLHLISLGFVGFFDAGEVWGRGQTLSGSGLLASVGVGLRLAGTRSGRQLPIRFDFAIPLIHHSGVSAVDFSTGAPQLFGTFGLPYANEQNTITDQENFAPDSTFSPYPNSYPFAYPGSPFTQY